MKYEYRDGFLILVRIIFIFTQPWSAWGNHEIAKIQSSFYVSVFKL